MDFTEKCFPKIQEDYLELKLTAKRCKRMSWCWGVFGKMADEIGFCQVQGKTHSRKGAQAQAHPVITAPQNSLWISLYKHQLSAHQRPKGRTYHRQIVNSTENTLCD